jgi:hypothetical protein
MEESLTFEPEAQGDLPTFHFCQEGALIAKKTAFLAWFDIHDIVHIRSRTQSKKALVNDNKNFTPQLNPSNS